ncbi:unnamed protein product [Cylindrotheca closterium]|uniref:DUF6824 domain-containing protein n=1 Tax=Cylindrotheca closterium TaxID=2856 RepID=A0AAD2G5E3_9STRA|nr:unnamed protein product [Cylindrotheca closterium]
MSDKTTQHPLDGFEIFNAYFCDVLEDCVDTETPDTEITAIISEHFTQSHITEEQNENNAIPTKLIEKMIKNKRGKSKKKVYSKSKKPSKASLVQKPKKTLTQQDKAKKIQQGEIKTIKTTKRKEKTTEEKKEDIQKKMKDPFGPICDLRPKRDVVCEPGSFGNENPSNKELIAKVRGALKIYKDLNSRKKKTEMINHIFDGVKSGGGRFLVRLDKREREWKEMKDEAGRDKISHMFRDEAKKARNGRKAEASFASLEMVAV